VTTLLFVSGSQRCGSFNSRLLRNVAQRLEGRCRIDMLVPADIDLPLFNQELEDTPEVIDRVAALHRRFKSSDGIVVASPEYNGQPTPYLVNIVAWVSRLAHVDNRFDNPFHGHPLMLCSASTGRSGGALAMPHARALFAYVGSLIAGDAICVPYADQAWTGSGYVFDPFFDEQIDATTENFLQQVQASVCSGRDRFETVCR
jgi:chromate reductase, NAD(P)H dehydrogenase (quinone)